MGLAIFFFIIQLNLSQIADLRIKLSSHISCSSNLQNRLISTLDALDALQTNAAASIQREAEANESFRNQTSAYRERIRQLEEEKNDMQSAISELIQKGKMSIYIFRTALENAICPGITDVFAHTTLLFLLFHSFFSL